jgi:hypothetical protein
MIFFDYNIKAKIIITKRCLNRGYLVFKVLNIAFLIRDEQKPPFIVIKLM